MAGSQKGRRHGAETVDAILALEALERLGMNRGQLGRALGYRSGNAVSNWIASGKMPATAARALEAVYAQRLKPPGNAIPAANTDQPARVIRLSHDAEEQPAPLAKPPVTWGGGLPTPRPEPQPAPAAAVGTEGFYVCTRFVNDKAVWRTTVSPNKTMVLNGKTYLMVPL